MFIWRSAESWMIATVSRDCMAWWYEVSYRVKPKPKPPKPLFHDLVNRNSNSYLAEFVCGLELMCVQHSKSTVPSKEPESIKQIVKNSSAVIF